MSRRAIAFLTIFALAPCLTSANLVIKECNEIKEKLTNSTGAHTLQWEPDCTNTIDESEFSFGALPEPETTRSIPERPPPNRIVPLKPGQTGRPTSGCVQLPAYYNAREVYGRYCPSFNQVPNQGTCGNCWAVATTSMINDRVCIYNDGKVQKVFSTAQLTSCVHNGCTGGWPSDALEFWKTYGLTTGGDYSANQHLGCQPYPRNATVLKTAKCLEVCHDGSRVSRGEKSIGGAKYQFKSYNQTEIMTEIFLYGPVLATYDVYDDFVYYYKKGIYKRVSDKKVGSHVSKLFGWGTENGVPFWFGVSSWGTNWGEGGFFRVQRGTNEVGIESNINAGVPLEGLSQIVQPAPAPVPQPQPYPQPYPQPQPGPVAPPYVYPVQQPVVNPWYPVGKK